jgi:hypothetical protein
MMDLLPWTCRIVATPYLCDGRSFACLVREVGDRDVVCVYRCITSDLKLFLALYYSELADVRQPTTL